MGTLLRRLPELAVLAAAIGCQWWLARWALGTPAVRGCAKARGAIRASVIVGTAWVGMSFLYFAPAADEWLGRFAWVEWVKGLSLGWAICACAVSLVACGYRRVPRFDPGRRRLIRTAAVALVAPPVAAAGFGVVERNRFRLREIDIAFPGLPADLHGLRLVQLSDIHLSPFLERSELRRAVDMANEVRADLALVTGDLITRRKDLLLDCLDELRRLRAGAGVLGCLGNHEQVARCEQQTKQEGARRGIDFLRGESRLMRFGSATINLAGVDYQEKFKPYLAGAGKLVRPGTLNILLSHNPDVFPVAAGQGFDLTVSGHTHGGQVTVEVLYQYVNVARFFTPYIYGLYRQGRSSIYVTRGLGTVGVPARVGAPAEIAVIRLCAT